MKKKLFIRYILLVIVALLAYGDTLLLKYASDDRMIIFENDYTLTGDVKSVMTKDAFTGYFGDGEQLVAGGRYRPLSQLTFMAEYTDGVLFFVVEQHGNAVGSGHADAHAGEIGY